MSASATNSRQRNSEARCGNCPYWKLFDSGAVSDAGMCKRFPDRIEHDDVVEACGEHPDFFLPETPRDIADATEFTCQCGEVFVTARRLTPEEQAVIDAVYESEKHLADDDSWPSSDWYSERSAHYDAVHATGKALLAARSAQ